MGFARIMPWFMQNLSEAIPEPTPPSIAAEGKPQNEWSKRKKTIIG